MVIDFTQDCLKIRDKIVCNQAGDYQVSGGKPQINTSVKTLKPEKPQSSPGDSHCLCLNPSFNNNGKEGEQMVKNRKHKK